MPYSLRIWHRRSGAVSADGSYLVSPQEVFVDGYQVVHELRSDGQPVHGKRSINEDEVPVIRLIFTEYASGKSPRRIAAELNTDGILSPRGGQWNASTINGNRGRRNGILQNELYRGQLIHNRVRIVEHPDTGRRISRVNPESEW